MRVFSGPRGRRVRATFAAGWVGLTLGIGLVPAAIASTASTYPPGAKKEFVSVCTKTAVDVGSGALSRKAAHRYCTLAFNCISKHLTAKQFEQVVERMQTGARNPKEKIVSKCERDAIAKILH